MPEFIPLYDGVLIVPDKIEESKKGGLLIPEVVKKNKTIVHGTVYAVGPNVPADLKKDMRVVYNTGAKIDLPLNDISYHFIKSPNIYCFASEEK